MNTNQLHHIAQVETSLNPNLHWLEAIRRAQACLINFRSFSKIERDEINTHLNNHYTIIKTPHEKEKQNS